MNARIGKSIMSSSNWKTMPLGLVILQTLEKREGVMFDNELINLVEQELGYRPSSAELTAELIKLEINGRINITNVKKNQRRISFLKSDQGFLQIGED